MRYVFTKLFLFAVVSALFMVPATRMYADGRAKPFVLVIDAGHGGHDAGACGAYSKEKNINLKVALEVGRLVKANCADVKVVYTRDKDVFIPLQKRADIANKHKADLFVSIHTNALPKGQLAYGSETYTLGMARAAANLEVAKRENSVITYEENYRRVYEGFDPNKAESYIIFELLQDRYMKQSVELARCIQQQYVSAGRKNKGVYQAGFLVLRNVTMPAVLTELGFISTPAEERYLNSSAGVKALGRSIYNGIIKYRRLHDKGRAQNLPPVITHDANDRAEAGSGDEAAEDRSATPNEVAVVPVDPSPQGSAVPRENSEERSATTPERTGSAATASEEQRRDSNEQQEHRSDDKAKTDAPDRPVFKVQLLVSDKILKTSDRRLKGLKDVAYYKENGMFKYTFGESRNYAEIRQVQKTLTPKFPDCFIVAFLDGARTNLAQAIKMSRQRQ